MEPISPLRRSVDDNLKMFEALAIRAQGTHNPKDLAQVLMLLQETIDHLTKVHEDLGKAIKDYLGR